MNYISELSEEERVVYGAIILISKGLFENAITVLADLLDEGNWQE